MFRCAQALQTLRRNNAGGAWNHAFFFQCMAPTAAGSNASANAPEKDGPLAKAIDASFGNFSAFKANFSEGAAKRFGSGFEWLIVETDSGDKLATTSTANQVGRCFAACKAGALSWCSATAYVHSSTCRECIYQHDLAAFVPLHAEFVGIS